MSAFFEPVFTPKTTKSYILHAHPPPPSAKLDFELNSISVGVPEDRVIEYQ